MPIGQIEYNVKKESSQSYLLHKNGFDSQQQVKEKMYISTRLNFAKVKFTAGNKTQ